MDTNFCPVLHHGENEHGRDFVVGDIHGMYDMLMELLHSVLFDKTKDRLFSVGDLVDRGTQNLAVCALIAEPWFLPVRGNHEQMAVEYVFNENMRKDIYISNGGKWFTELTRAEQLSIAEVFAVLPYARSFLSKGCTWGVIHADIKGSSFFDFCAELMTHEDRSSEIAMWSRSRMSAHKIGYPTSTITDVTGLIVGHTPVKDIVRMANVLDIDTGGCFKDGKLTMVQISGTQWRMHACHAAKP